MGPAYLRSRQSRSRPSYAASYMGTGYGGDAVSTPFYRWFRDATLNTCYNALDRHVVRGRADQPALIYDSPVTGQQRTLTYAELTEQEAAFAGALRWLRGRLAVVARRQG